MKNKLLLILYSICCCFTMIRGQQYGPQTEDAQITIEKHTNKVGKAQTLTLEEAPPPSASTNSKSSSSGIGETPGILSINLSGATTYDVPIAVPPGIAGVVPQLSISYNSQAGAGLARWGWNISGVSSITRIPATEYHDGVKDPVDFDALDRFALDGQRLVLVSGTYGKNGAVYETEGYSNLKITSHGVSPFGANYGPSYFTVYYPDGAIAVYGNSSDSRTRLEYAITYMDNPQKIRISYAYNTTDNVNINTISSIRYGGKGSATPINEVKFNYINRYRIERSYIGGTAFGRFKMLSSITSLSSGKRFRHYTLGYSKSRNQYARLSDITEHSGDNTKTHSPIKFKYTNIQFDTMEYIPVTASLSVSGTAGNNSSVVPLDLTGNKELDFVIYPNSKDKLFLFEKENLNQHYTLSTGGRFEELIPTRFVDNTNKYYNGDGFTLIHHNGTDVSFKTYSRGLGLYEINYSKTWTGAPRQLYMNSCSDDRTYRVAPMEYISGDYDGDGITDILAINKPHSNRDCIQICDSPSCCQCTDGDINTSSVYKIDLDRSKTSSFTKYMGILSQAIGPKDLLLSADMDGDGKTDLLQITPGKIIVYGINNSGNFVQLWQTNSNKVNPELPVLLGDYNGDGKTDILHASAVNSTIFNYFFSRGTNFLIQGQTMPFSHKNAVWDAQQGKWTTPRLIPLDIDGDGKTDIIHYETVTYNDPNKEGYQRITPYYCQSRSGDLAPRMDYGGKIKVNGNVKHYPIPIFFNQKDPNYGLDFATISDRHISSFKFNYNHHLTHIVQRVENNGVHYELKHSPLDSKILTSLPHYLEMNNQSYPYIDINSAQGLQITTQITRKVPNTPFPNTIRDFFYKGAVSHIDGIGFMGFQQIAQSNWHTGAADRIYTNIYRDMAKRGVTTEVWETPETHKLGFATPDYISKTTNRYEMDISGNKSFNLLLDHSTSQNKLLGTTTTSHFQYDAYSNPTVQTVNYSGHGSTTTEINYANNPGSGYYIGRPTYKKTTATIGANSFTTEEKYSYNGFLLSQRQTKGNGTQWDNEFFEYDTFGNIVKTYDAPYGEAQRINEMKYESSGRFIKESIDIEGLKTTYKFDPYMGYLNESTDPFGLTTSYEYDSWNRQDEMTDYLGNRSTTEYVEDSFYYTVTQKGPDGGVSASYYDPLKRKLYDRFKGLNGAWRQVNYRYDALDRRVGQSEPHTGAPAQWNLTEYDRYGRPKTETLHTGKVNSYSYDGLSITVNDGTQTVTTKRDALGNVVRVDDPGGTITYTYFGNGQLKSSSYNGLTQSIEQDGWGRKTKLTDPSAGVYTYAYNGFGEVTQVTSPKGSTTYTYTPTGRVTQEKVKGDQTDLVSEYRYDNTTKLLTQINANDLINDKGFTYLYNYDEYERLTKIQEYTLSATFEREIQFDNFGRLKREEYLASFGLSGGNSSTAHVDHYYDNYGNYKGVNEYLINATNARGQVTEASTIGNQLVTNKYDTYGFIEDTKVKNEFDRNVSIHNTYAFNAQRGTLSNRSHKTTINGNVFSESNSFQYDNLDRLTRILGNQPSTISYDPSGRITQNNKIGAYKYQGGSKKYQLKEISLNSSALDYYKGRSPRTVLYNAFKKPVNIETDNGGSFSRVAFEYGPFRNRTEAFYGGGHPDKNQLRYHKTYSSIAPIEIIHDKNEGTQKFVFFLGGDGYSAPAAQVDVFKGGNLDASDRLFLQRDYQGSILNILREVSGKFVSTEIVERRAYTAFGKPYRYWSKDGGSLEDGFKILDRGYTGHEHFMEVGLIHMNGRMYDPDLHRMLSPDSYIQNPYNTQNFNRYSYVMNNPLMYTDPSGEMYEDPEGGGLSNGGQTFIGGAIGSVVNSWDNWGMKGFFNNDFTRPFREVGRWLRKRLGFDDRVQTKFETPQTNVAADPTMNSNPGVGQVFTGIGTGFGNFWSGLGDLGANFIDSPWQTYKNYWGSEGYKNLIPGYTAYSATLGRIFSNFGTAYDVGSGLIGGDYSGAGEAYGGFLGLQSFDGATLALTGGIGRGISSVGSFLRGLNRGIGVRSSYKVHFDNWRSYADIMESRGVSVEHIAKRVSNARLAARGRYQLQTPLFTRLFIYARNITPAWMPIRFPIGGKWIKPGGYNNMTGPNWQFFRSKGYTWERILEGSLRSNSKL